MRSLAEQMSTTGQAPPPNTIAIGGATYALGAVLKDDFFATTALYHLDNSGSSASPDRVILKTGRRAPFFGLPLRWLGRLLTSHELAIMQLLGDIPGIPRLIERLDSTSFAYEYIPGWTLDQDPGIPDHFFEQLHNLVDSIHSRNIVYVDMNKRGNIIVGDDGRPHLIDFQISLHLPGVFLAPIRNVFSRADYYHLYKHKFRLAPHLATSVERKAYGSRGLLITLHRIITVPYRVTRRALFRYLYSHGILKADDNIQYTRENHPARFLR